MLNQTLVDGVHETGTPTEAMNDHQSWLTDSLNLFICELEDALVAENDSSDTDCISISKTKLYVFPLDMFYRQVSQLEDVQFGEIQLLLVTLLLRGWAAAAFLSHT